VKRAVARSGPLLREFINLFFDWERVFFALYMADTEILT
jgi:hypothetical protein